MRVLATATILLISLTDVMAQAPSATQAGDATLVSVPVQQPPVSLSSPDGTVQLLQSAVITRNLAQQTSDPERQTLDTVLVVPGPDLKPETLAAITQDMMVMCRIFDKTLYPTARSTGASLYVHQGDLPLLGRLPAQQTGRTQGLYLEGYGAVFFIHVDFPIVPPAPQKEEPQPQESADRVWSQALDELRGKQDARETAEAAMPYDATKVENLKTSLIKTLRHAVNIRIPSQDWIAVVVGGQNQPSAGAYRQQLDGYFYSLGGRTPGAVLQKADGSGNPVLDPAATLVLRVAKSDLEALASQKLTGVELAGKVQTFWSRAQAQAAEPPSTPAPTPASR